MTPRAFLSSDWYRVAALKPRLRGHIDIHRQRFRGDIWFILQDRHSGKYHRITPAAHHILALMNGTRSIHEIWEAVCARFGDDPPTQSETIRLLSQLHGADLIACDMPPDMAEIGARHMRQERQSMIARIKNPLALRLPLLDPDRFLAATLPLVRWLFTPPGFAAWLLLVGTGLVLAGMNWTALTEGFRDQAFAAENLLVIALAYPVVKTLHELGHGYATKVWGGEVHEVGVMFLIFIPVPYVDASAASAFASKWRRAVVGGAGIMVELALASLALIFWLEAEPGLARAIAFNIMLIGGISTLLFNGNPLLRFDGYFVLCDLIEVPNLGQRSNKYVFYLLRRYLFGLKQATSPVTARGERRWLLSYALAAFAYRLFISIAIALFVASTYFAIGVALAIWALVSSFGLPLLKGLRYLVTSPELRPRRGFAMGVVSLGLGALLTVLLLLPAPYLTTAYGVVWLAPSDIVRAGTEGFVTRVETPDGGKIDAGQPVLSMEDPQIDHRIAILASRITEGELRLRAATLSDQVEARLVRDRLDLLREQKARLEDRRAALTLNSPETGTLALPNAQDLTGRLVRQGEILGYVLGRSGVTLRVAIPQGEAELIRHRTEAVELVFLDQPHRSLKADLVAEIPRSDDQVPSAALLTEGGGQFVRNPNGRTPLSTLERPFQFEIRPQSPLPVERVGARALVKFDHGTEPVGYRLYRGVRQLFLRQFHV